MAKNQIHKIGEHTYVTPNIPSKKDILFSDKPKEQQFWLREPYPKLFLDYVPNFTEFDKEATLYDEDNILISLNIEDSKIVYDLLLREKERRRNGVWFMNNGEPVYITGSHYFTLQACPMYAVNANITYKSWQRIFEMNISTDLFYTNYADYGRYMEFQRDIFYLLDLVDNDEECAGIFLTKAKKTGVTMLIACHILNLATMNKGAWIGLISKTSDAALETNFVYLHHALMGLPKALQPMISSMAKATGEIGFGATVYRGNNKKQKALAQMDQKAALNSKVKCLPTKIKALDAPVVFRGVIDEPTKIFSDSKISVQQLFDTSLATVKFQQTINGKLYLSCYVSEENDEGVDDCRRIYFDSKLKTRGQGKRTKSELYCHHISALYSYLSLIDKYGKCDEKAANALIEEALEKSKTDPRTFQSMKRQNARNENEAWGIGSAKSLFNPIELNRQIEFVREYKRDSSIPVGIFGYLKWDVPLWEAGKKNKRPLGKISNVIFHPVSIDEFLEGANRKIIMYKRIDSSKLNMAVRLDKDDKGNFIAPDKFEFFGGTDPVNYVGDVVEGSKIASYTLNLHNEGINSRHRKIETKVLVSEFFHRSDNPDENFEDILKDIVYFSKLVLVEGNTTYTAERLVREGFSNYMIFKNKEKALTLYKPWMVYGEDCFLVRRTANADQDNLMDDMIRVAKDYLEVIEEEHNYLAQIMSEELLMQLLNFDIKNTKRFDRAMAFFYTLLCYDTYRNYMLEGQDDEFNKEDNYAAIIEGLTFKDYSAQTG